MTRGYYFDLKRYLFNLRGLPFALDGLTFTLDGRPFVVAGGSIALFVYRRFASLALLEKRCGGSKTLHTTHRRFLYRAFLEALPAYRFISRALLCTLPA